MVSSLKSLEDFKKAIAALNQVPYHSGTVALDKNVSSLFYSLGNSNARVIDFSQTTDEELSNLAKTCDPATFGRNEEDVLDESYRKAGKMDASNFATHFNPAEHGIIEAISDTLLRGRAADRGLDIRVELYKLNVYGPGAFFKAHVDTPRSKQMFGSLVVILPTAHEGGSLIFRHGGKEWTFDSAKAVNTESTPHAAFVTFFSDVEHEVTPVTSGYRVTLTYNLYLGAPSVGKAVVRSAAHDLMDEQLASSLSKLLKDPGFLPGGGFLAFGMSHKYPFDRNSSKSLLHILKFLKGTDASIKRACDAVSLPLAVKTVYRDNGDSCLVDGFADLLDQVDGDVSFARYLTEYDGAKIIHDVEGGVEDMEDDDSDDEMDSDDKIPVVWAKRLANTNSFSTPYVAYGNEASLCHAYGEVCLIATIRSFAERTA